MSLTNCGGLWKACSNPTYSSALFLEALSLSDKPLQACARGFGNWCILLG